MWRSDVLHWIYGLHPHQPHEPELCNPPEICCAVGGPPMRPRYHYISSPYYGDFHYGGEFVGHKGRGFDPLPQICPSVWPGNWVSNSHSNKWAASRRGVSPLGVSPLGVEIPPG
ncbi:hypothetical protein DY000_02054209 [Brassica cretica]|uniref:Uncharacterized protein n=1 Tax=Brassica cretica TaxID=69181 RepID=A0ABQ7AD65_BRACR|nr:hypothetical protein DY000_02054209 [Brassica cretica]